MLTDRLIVLSWAVFCGYWALSALSARASTGLISSLRRYLPVLLIIPAISLVHLAVTGDRLPHHETPVVAIRLLGAMLCVLGVASAIWARACLGDNWGMPMTRRKVPQLVTRGPYAYVRHPIYTGILLGIVGTTIATSPKALGGLPLFVFAYFCLSAIKEERDMLKKFPEQYRAYMSRTKRLIPFVWQEPRTFPPNLRRWRGSNEREVQKE